MWNINGKIILFLSVVCAVTIRISRFWPFRISIITLCRKLDDISWFNYNGLKNRDLSIAFMRKLSLLSKFEMTNTITHQIFCEVLERKGRERERYLSKRMFLYIGKSVLELGSDQSMFRWRVFE